MGKARVWILAALAMAASALSACNVVSTKTPMFGPQDASSLKLRDGVWRQAPDPDKACKFDETKPVDTWPECVDPLLVRGGEFFPWRGESKSWNPEGAGKALLVAGDTSLANCLAGVNDMLAICEPLITMASNHSTNLPALAAVAAAISEECEAVCRTHASEHAQCATLADSCAACARECRAVAA